MIACSANLRAKVLYVATDGNDAQTGTFEHPLASVQKAQALISAGDTVFIRGGDYLMTESDISKVEQNLFACITFLDKSGSAGKMINYFAYPGETPHFDFTAVKPADQRVVGFWVGGSYLHIKGIEITGIQVTITTHTESYGIYSWGSYNIFENISIHDNLGTGLRHRRGGHNLFLNCDSYRNHDNVSENKLGGNTDGFGCHPTSSGKGNVFKGCRSWFNSDDGFDCIRSDEAITFDSCWSFYNGYSPDFQSLADGNGFKAGGYAYDDSTKIPDPVPSNTIRFCVSARNKANGFYSNHHLTGNKWYNNSAYMNAINFNMVNRESPSSSNINVDGYDHVLINNLSYGARSSETAYIDTTQNTLENNSFNLPIIITDADFVSLDIDQLTAPRKPDGSLPDVDFMRPEAGSVIIDAGKDIGYPFAGAAPDLGAFEYYPPVGVTELSRKNEMIIYPNPVSDILTVKGDPFLQAEILDLTGKIVKTQLNNNTIDVSILQKGIYLIKLENKQHQTVVRKFVKK